jgi:hypothetical protein
MYFMIFLSLPSAACLNLDLGDLGDLLDYSAFAAMS